jgi:hypothetical protein
VPHHFRSALHALSFLRIADLLAPFRHRILRSKEYVKYLLDLFE